MELNKIYNEDCLDTMRRMEDNFIDLTVTSPPYDNLRTYNGYVFGFEAIAKELYRVTKEGGLVVWVVGDATVKGSETGTSFRQALYFKEIGFNLHDTMIYQKRCYLPQNQHPRYSPTFEYMFILSKGYPKTFNPQQEKAKGGISKGRGQKQVNDEYRHENNKIMLKGIKKRKTNIWEYSTGGKVKGIKNKKHPAIFPEQLASDHIVSWSNENDVVYDPFMGSGTTAKMARINNRNYIGSEISSEYCAIISERLATLF